MAVALASLSSVKQGGANATLTCTFASDGPSTANGSNAPSAGDVYHAVYSIAGDSTNQAVFNTPSGWTKIAEFTTTADTSTLVVFRKVMTGAETSVACSVSVGGQAAQGANLKVLRFTGVDTTTPEDTTPVVTARTVANPIVLDGITTVTANCLIASYVGGYSASVRTYTWATSTEQFDHSIDPSSGFANTLTGATKTQASPGGTGTEEVTCNTSHGACGAVIALRPAGAVSSTPANNKRLLLGIG